VAERLRALLERPLDAAVARAAIVLAAGLFTGVALLALVTYSGESGARRQPGSASAGPQRPVRFPPPRSLAPGPVRPGSAGRRGRPAQDPQDRSGGPAARRAARELRAHRALQHVPYRHGALRISLTGAQGERAVLSVTAPTLARARRGWGAFLRRYRDEGRAYLPRFRSPGGPHG
jgi:hypothetical protein